MNQTIKKGMVVIGVMAVFIGLFICNFFVSFGYGGWFGLLAEFRSLPKEEKLEALRSAAIQDLTQAHVELGSVTGLTLYEKTHSDMCAKGEHGWKRSDSYAYVCSYRLTYYYGTNREYKELLLELEKTLNRLGWMIEEQTPKQPTISESIRAYSGEIFLVELPSYHKKMAGSSSVTLVINGFDGYGGYWNVGSTEPDPFGFGIGILQEIYKNASDKSPEEIFNKIISSGQQAIMIAISTEYFSN